MTRLTIPHLSANVTDATLTKWLKHPGDAVRKGDAVAEITTEKATFELEATADGTLIETLAPERSMLPVGYIVALLGRFGETDPEAEELNCSCLEQARLQRESPAVPADAPTVQAPPPANSAGRVRATPKARRLARERNLSLDTIQAATGAEIVTETVLKEFIAQEPSR